MYSCKCAVHIHCCHCRRSFFRCPSNAFKCISNDTFCFNFVPRWNSDSNCGAFLKIPTTKQKTTLKMREWNKPDERMEAFLVTSWHLKVKHTGRPRYDIFLPHIFSKRGRINDQAPIFRCSSCDHMNSARCNFRKQKRTYSDEASSLSL